MSRPDVAVLKMVRLSFPHLWTPTAATEDGKKKFRASALMDPETAQGKANIEAVKKAMNHVAKEKWKDKAERITKALEKNRKCLRNGDDSTNEEGEVYDGYEGMMVLVAANDRRPQVLDRDKTPVAEEDDVMYAGCYVDIVASFYTVDGKERGGNGIFASLEIVRFRKDGEAFGAAPLDADDYLDDEDEDEAEDDVI